MQHFFADRSWVQGDKIRLEGSDVNHMKNVLRMKDPGEDGERYRTSVKDLAVPGTSQRG